MLCKLKRQDVSLHSEAALNEKTETVVQVELPWSYPLMLNGSASVFIN